MFKHNDKHKQQSLFESTQWMNAKIRVKLEKSWAPIFYEHVFSKIDEKPFAILYSDIGAPNFPINILLSLEYIKHMKQCSDLELMDSFDFDYLVNYAVGNRTLGEMNLAERTLNYFRERVYTYCLQNPDKEDMLFKQFLQLLHEFSEKSGIKMNEQRTDTTMFMSNIKKAGRISLAYDVLVKAIKAIPEEKRTTTLTAVLEPAFKTDLLFHTKNQEGEGKLISLLERCQEAVFILESQTGSETIDALRIAKRFLNEQAITEKDGKQIPKPGKEITSGSLQSAHDEDATYRKKGNKGQSGYVLEISETCGNENPYQLITDYVVKPNNINDADILEERLPEIRKNTGCTEMVTDGGFQSETIHETAKQNGMEMQMTNMSGTEPKKIPVTEFEIDETNNLIQKCPGGQIPIYTKTSKEQTTAHFTHEACEGCTYWERCYSKKQVKNNIVRINIKTIKTSRERKRMKTNQFKNTRKRAGIEGSNSALKRKGLGKLNVRGKIKSTIVCGLKVTVQNIKRFIKYMQGGYNAKKTSTTHQGISVPSYS